MFNAIQVMVVMTVLGAISSGIGGFLGGAIKTKNDDILAGLFEITAGIMTGIVCFDMLPESFKIASIGYSILGIVCGIILVYFINYFVERENNNKKVKKYTSVSLVVMISMAVHNAIEGLAIGSGFAYSFSLGITILISIFLHDIPEGMVVGVTNKTNNQGLLKNILQSAFVGACVGVGCFVGAVLGNIDDRYIAFSLSIAAGAMLYIVACELIPNSKQISSRKIVSVMYILGILIGAILNMI